MAFGDETVTSSAGECVRAAECRRNEPPARCEKDESGHEVEEHHVGRLAGIRLERQRPAGVLPAALEGRVSRCPRGPNNSIFWLARGIRLAAGKVMGSSATTPGTLLAYDRAACELKIRRRRRVEPAIGPAEQSAGIPEHTPMTQQQTVPASQQSTASAQQKTSHPRISTPANPALLTYQHKRKVRIQLPE